MGSKSPISLSFQKTGTGSDDFQKFNKRLKITQSRRQSYNFVAGLRMEIKYLPSGLLWRV
jgi:hypothetical protein